MKKALFIIGFLSAVAVVNAQSISHIETTKSWYNIYDKGGKIIKSLSTGLGELVGYSSSFYIIKQKTDFCITYDVNVIFLLSKSYPLEVIFSSSNLEVIFCYAQIHLSIADDGESFLSVYLMMTILHSDILK